MTVLVPGIAVSLFAGLMALRGPDPDAVPSLQQVADRTISPYCAPLTIAECPSNKGAQLRQDIGARIDAGWTNRRIDAWLVANFGAWLVGTPGGKFTKLFPAGAILVGTILIAGFLVRRSERGRSQIIAPAADPEDLEQIQRELAVFRTASE